MPPPIKKKAVSSIVRFAERRSLSQICKGWASKFSRLHERRLYFNQLKWIRENVFSKNGAKNIAVRTHKIVRDFEPWSNILVAIGLFFAVIGFALEIDDRQSERIFRAWEILLYVSEDLKDKEDEVASERGDKKTEKDKSSRIERHMGSSAVRQALEYLHRDFGGEWCREWIKDVSIYFTGNYARNCVFPAKTGESFAKLALPFTNLSGIVLPRANFQGADLRGVSLQDAILEEARLVETRLEGAFLMGADLQRAHLVAARLRGANLNGANLESAILVWAGLRDANLDDANLQGADLRDANLEDADLEGANLEYAKLRGSNLTRAKLNEANLRGATMVWARLKDVNLDDANLEGAELIRANLEDASLWRANLERAILVAANLERANLEDVSLKGALLIGANLQDANLAGANLEGAKLRGAILEGLRLEELGLEDTNLEGVEGLEFHVP